MPWWPVTKIRLSVRLLIRAEDCEARDLRKPANRTSLRQHRAARIAWLRQEPVCHGEKRSDAAIHLNFSWIAAPDFVGLAMTDEEIGMASPSLAPVRATPTVSAPCVSS
jgi:hypothetical protein